MQQSSILPAYIINKQSTSSRSIIRSATRALKTALLIIFELFTTVRPCMVMGDYPPLILCMLEDLLLVAALPVQDEQEIHGTHCYQLQVCTFQRYSFISTR